MNTCGGCTATWAALHAAHCGACHETFTTPSNFDRHRKDGQCQPPANVGLVASDRGGTQMWHQPGAPAADVNDREFWGKR
jgi:hypothetical protein